jgi:hypothetical protein
VNNCNVLGGFVAGIVVGWCFSLVGDWPLITCVLFLFGSFACYMLVRNEVVHRFKVAVLDDDTRTVRECLERHVKLPPYETMLFQLTRFDWSDYMDEVE